MEQASEQGILTQKGLAVLHLFTKVEGSTDRGIVEQAVKQAVADGNQVVPVAILGHKADLAFMLLGDDPWSQRRFQSRIQCAGLKVSESFVSMTELSEYAAGVPEQMRQARLFPELPPEGKLAYCFYPMTKRRDPEQNWYALGYDEREQLMRQHGKSGRAFAGKVTQVVTGSTGLDDWEWGVTLFGLSLGDLKDCVYTMRFDEASTHYAEFGPFYTGMVGSLEQVLDELLGS